MMLKRFIAVVLLAAPTAANAQDQVITTRGTTATGDIVDMSPLEVVLDARGTKRRIPTNEIRRVSFGEDPVELKRARDKLLVGQVAAAQADLQKLESSGIEREEIQQDVQFYLALSQGRLALTEGGDKSAATAAMLNFARNHPNSFHFLEAAELLGDLAVAQEQYADAVKYYRVVGSKAPWPAHKLRAVILEAKARLEEGNYGEARDLFGKAVAIDIGTPDALQQKTLARIGEAVCLAELGSVDEGQAIIQNILSKHDPEDSVLFGQAYNALGRCHLKANRTKDALMAYLHVDLLFYEDPDVHAESLYHLTDLWEQLNHKKRARSARTLLMNRYAGNKWAKKSL